MREKKKSSTSRLSAEKINFLPFDLILFFRETGFTFVSAFLARAFNEIERAEGEREREYQCQKHCLSTV